MADGPSRSDVMFPVPFTIFCIHSIEGGHSRNLPLAFIGNIGFPYPSLKGSHLIIYYPGCFFQHNVGVGLFEEALSFNTLCSIGLHLPPQHHFIFGSNLLTSCI